MMATVQGWAINPKGQMSGEGRGERFGQVFINWVRVFVWPSLVGSDGGLACMVSCFHS
jgi:hypothetical protein